MCLLNGIKKFTRSISGILFLGTLIVLLLLIPFLLIDKTNLLNFIASKSTNTYLNLLLIIILFSFPLPVYQLLVFIGKKAVEKGFLVDTIPEFFSINELQNNEKKEDKSDLILKIIGVIIVNFLFGAVCLVVEYFLTGRKF